MQHNHYITDMATNVFRVSTPGELLPEERAAPGRRRLPMTDTTEFLNVRDTAKTLGIHENTVRNLEKKGELKAVRLPGSGFRRFRKEDIERMRNEMWSQFAPDTTLPTKRTKPAKQHILTEEDYRA
jgi:excisionase family DNA binding protein